ncbi:CRISPR-associated protein Cas5 [Nostoc sp.]
MIAPLILYLDVPFTTFRESHAREMGKTYPVPPPATVYGMLLSLVGETNVYRHCVLKIDFPCIEEQGKIVDFLRAIDQKIEAVSFHIEKIEQFKKGLLQKMFV